MTAQVATPVTLRAMRWWDIEPLLPWEQMVFPHDPWTAAGFWSELAGVPETRFYLLADIDGEPAGYGGLMCLGDAADIQTIAVVPHHQGHGVGRALLEALIAEAARRGAATVMLEVRSDNAPALHLYESRGFDRQAYRRDYYGRGHDAVVMRLRPAR